MSRSCEESLAIRCEKQARVSPTPNGGARGHSGENTPNKLNIGVADSRRSLSALRPQQKQKRDKPRYGILPVKPKFASAYGRGGRRARTVSGCVNSAFLDISRHFVVHLFRSWIPSTARGTDGGPQGRGA